MTLRDEATARIDDTLATTIGEVVAVDCLTSFAFFAETESFTDDQFVCAEAVMELNHVDLVWGDSSGAECFFRRMLGHASTDKIDH